MYDQFGEAGVKGGAGGGAGAYTVGAVSVSLFCSFPFKRTAYTLNFHIDKFVDKKDCMSLGTCFGNSCCMLLYYRRVCSVFCCYSVKI